MQTKWIAGAALTFLAGMLAGHALDGTMSTAIPMASAAEPADIHDGAAPAGIEALHKLDVRVTLLNDPKALQQEWSDNAVRLLQDAPVDIGKNAIYASDIRSMAEQPGSAVVSYSPDIKDIRVNGDWAFEWGYFDAGFREGKDKPVSSARGKLLRVLHRESGQWKFFRVMVMWNENSGAQAR